MVANEKVVVMIATGVGTFKWPHYMCLKMRYIPLKNSNLRLPEPSKRHKSERLTLSLKAMSQRKSTTLDMRDICLV